MFERLKRFLRSPFMQGFGSTFCFFPDVGETLEERLNRLNTLKTDEEAIRRDWEAIGFVFESEKKKDSV